MMVRYYIDRQGGMHYHRRDCVTLKTQSRHESILRSARKTNSKGNLDKIVEGGRSYIPCPACFGGRSREASEPAIPPLNPAIAPKPLGRLPPGR